uniref:Uncharacterized protein n=1 Tax=Triticum urartu TaxID=4572 RepID=A0A8R7U832_TRIUA
MDHRRMHNEMEVMERGGHVAGDGEAARPLGHQLGAPLPQQRVLQRAVGHELVDEHHPAAAGVRGERVGEGQEDGGRGGVAGADEMGGEGELVVELALALEGPGGVHDLDGHGLARPGQRAAEDGAESALPELAPGREAARGAPQLLVRQPPQQGGRGLRPRARRRRGPPFPPATQPDEEGEGRQEKRRRGGRGRGGGHRGGREPVAGGGSEAPDDGGGGGGGRGRGGIGRRGLARGHQQRRGKDKQSGRGGVMSRKAIWLFAISQMRAS